LFITLRTADLLNNPPGGAAPGGLALPVSIIVPARSSGIPAELAAAMDGCGPSGSSTRSRPDVAPVLATVSVLRHRGQLNAFLLPLVVLNDPDMWTLPSGATNFSTQYLRHRPVLAFTSLSMVPALVFT
jgi:raffinose/stachyose/melibiose transport system permease protein